MVRVVETLGRIVVVVAGCAAAYAMADVLNGEAVGWVAAAAVLLLAGALANRLWAAWLPLAAFVPWTLYQVAFGAKEDARDFTWEVGVALMGVVAALVSFTLVAGVWARRLAARGSSRPRTTLQGSR